MYYDFKKSVLTSRECQEIYDILKHKVSLGEFNNGDAQCKSSQGFYGGLPDHIIEKFHPIVAEFAQCNVNYSYNYSRTCPHGEVLPIHKDRTACQFSVTVNIHNTTIPWPFWVTHPGTQESQSFEMQPGDCLLYLGCEVPHWREYNQGQEVCQSFIHFCDDDSFKEVSQTEYRIIQEKSRADGARRRHELKSLIGKLK